MHLPFIFIYGVSDIKNILLFMYQNLPSYNLWLLPVVAYLDFILPDGTEIKIQSLIFTSAFLHLFTYSVSYLLQFFLNIYISNSGGIYFDVV